MTEITLRPATESEAKILTAIHQECFPTYWSINSFNDFFSVDGTLALLAENPHAVGMMVYRLHHEQADIITIAVRPACRRRGIARALLAQAMQTMASRGVNAIFLDVEDGNVAALQLYETHGFTVINRRKHYYKQKDGSFTDALVMTRKLS